MPESVHGVNPTSGEVGRGSAERVGRSTPASIDPRSPCIIGVGQRAWRPGGDPAPEPLTMWEAVTRHAAAEVGPSPVLEDIDAVHLVHCMSWAYDDPARRLAERLRLRDGFREVSVLAGTAGQRMVNSAAERMLEGRSALALVVGGEALATRRRLLASGASPPWSHPSPDQGSPPIDLDQWVSPTEWVHDVVKPTVTFAALDAARRKMVGSSPDQHLALEGALLERFTEVAQANPHAWFPIRRSAKQIMTVTPENRLISSPYTKYMVAIMDVDMAAGLIMATHEKADELGVPQDQRVYLRGWSFGRDATHLAERAFLDRSPAMVAAAADALSQAGIGIDDAAHLDLYSCFASSVLFASDALRIDPLDGRGLTVTGGLPYHGGPSSNYTTHAIATMVQLLREESRAFGVVSGVGMHMTKHVWGVYGTEPGRLRPPSYADVQRDIDRHGSYHVVQVLDDAHRGTIGAFTVSHERDGTPGSALIIADLGNGERAYARVLQPDLLSHLSVGEHVGRAVTLRPGPGGLNEVVELSD